MVADPRPGEVDDRVGALQRGEVARLPAVGSQVDLVGGGGRRRTEPNDVVAVGAQRRDQGGTDQAGGPGDCDLHARSSPGGARRANRDRPQGSHGSCHLAVAGDQVVSGRRTPRARCVGLDRRGVVEQRLHDPPGLLDPVLAGEVRACHRAIAAVEQHLVRRRALAALARRRSCRAWIGARPDRVGALGVQAHAGAGAGSTRTTSWLGSGRWARRPKPRLGGCLKTSRSSVCRTGSVLPVRMKNGTPAQRQLSICSRSGGEGLGRRSRGRRPDRAVAVVLAADVVGGARLSTAWNDLDHARP